MQLLLLESFKKPFMRNVYRAVPVLAAVMLYAGGTYAASAGEKEEPEVDYQYDIQAIHVGETHAWTPFAAYPGLDVTYESSDPEVLTIRDDGMLLPHKEGDVVISAATRETDAYQTESYEIFLYVFPGEDGLYLSDISQHFYYQGKEYGPGELPLETERALCLTQPDLKVYLEDYLAPWQEKTEDPTEAALSAILNYGAGYFDREVLFDGYAGNSESGKTDWMILLERKVGLCSYHSSLFCYLMYLAGLPSVQMDSPLTEERAHSWNLIAHDGYCYNLEEYHFLHGIRERYAAPPLSEAVAAYYPGHIIEDYVMHFPVAGNDFTPDIKFGDMGRDLSEQCPVLMYEKTPEGEYRVWFDTVRAGKIPAYSDQTPLTLEDMVYQDMETDTEGDQYNKEATAVFGEADRMLQEEVGGLFREE